MGRKKNEVPAASSRPEATKVIWDQTCEPPSDQGREWWG
jgi:hypothetical protein